MPKLEPLKSKARKISSFVTAGLLTVYQGLVGIPDILIIWSGELGGIKYTGQAIWREWIHLLTYNSVVFWNKNILNIFFLFPYNNLHILFEMHDFEICYSAWFSSHVVKGSEVIKLLSEYQSWIQQRKCKRTYDYSMAVKMSYNS